MKTNKLIALLQAADPSGEEECSIGNADIWSVDVEPAYYDGALHVIERDEQNRPVRGWRKRSGNKVVLSLVTIDDALEYPGFEVIYQTPEDRARYESIDKQSLAEYAKAEIEVDMDGFREFVFRKAQVAQPVALALVNTVREAADKFYNEMALSPSNPITLTRKGHSYRDCRNEYLEEHIAVVWDRYGRLIIAQKQQAE